MIMTAGAFYWSRHKVMKSLRKNAKTENTYLITLLEGSICLRVVHLMAGN